MPGSWFNAWRPQFLGDIDKVNEHFQLPEPRIVRGNHLSHTRTTGLPAKPNWYPREGGADSEGAGPRPPKAPISTMPRFARGACGHGRRLGDGNLPSRHRPDLASRRPLHAPPRLPAGPCRVGPADALGRPQPRTRVVPVRAPGDTTTARTLRLPAARSPILDRSDPRWHGATVPRAEYDPVAAGVARRSVNRR